MIINKKTKRKLIQSAISLSFCLTFSVTGFTQDGADIDWPSVKKVWDLLTPDEQAAYQSVLDEMKANEASSKPPSVTILGQNIEASNTRVPGNTCGAATHELATPPFADSGTTIGNSNDYELLADCGGASFEPYQGADWAYRVQVDTDCDLQATVTNESYDAAVYVLTDCGTQTCVSGGDDPEDAAFTATAGTDYFVIVDGWQTQEGTYDLAITETTATGCELVPVELQSFSID